SRRGAWIARVDNNPRPRLVLRADDRDADRPVGGAGPQGVDERLPRHGLVRDHEDVPGLGHQRETTSSRSGTSARSPFRTAWRAPRTPYSYGLPTTCGISSKLKMGGGEDTCHSSVSARHGFAGAIGPRRHETIMLYRKTIVEAPSAKDATLMMKLRLPKRSA